MEDKIMNDFKMTSTKDPFADSLAKTENYRDMFFIQPRLNFLGAMLHFILISRLT